MVPPPRRTLRLLIMLALLGLATGCGTTRLTDTKRTATEQLLISDAMDRAVSQINCQDLAGKSVYLDDTPIKGVTDHEYLSATVIQHLLSSGCIVRSKDDADYTVVLRAGAVGTDTNELLYGIPSINIPAVVPTPAPVPPIPEVPFVKKTDQRAVVKIALHAYNNKTGRPLFNSGNIPVESTAKNTWIFGAGPFQKGSIYDGLAFAGDRIDVPLVDLRHDATDHSLSVAQEAHFIEPNDEAFLSTLKKDGSEKESPPPDAPSSEEIPAPDPQRRRPPLFPDTGAPPYRPSPPGTVPQRPTPTSPHSPALSAEPTQRTPTLPPPMGTQPVWRQ